MMAYVREHEINKQDESNIEAPASPADDRETEGGIAQINSRIVVQPRVLLQDNGNEGSPSRNDYDGAQNGIRVGSMNRSNTKKTMNERIEATMKIVGFSPVNASIQKKDTKILSPQTLATGETLQSPSSMEYSLSPDVAMDENGRRSNNRYNNNGNVGTNIQMRTPQQLHQLQIQQEQEQLQQQRRNKSQYAAASPNQYATPEKRPENDDNDDDSEHNRWNKTFCILSICYDQELPILWISLLLASLLDVAAFETYRYDNAENDIDGASTITTRTVQHSFILAMMIISLCISLISIILSAIKKLSLKVEIKLIVVTLLIWISVLPVIMDPNNGIAIDYSYYDHNLKNSDNSVTETVWLSNQLGGSNNEFSSNNMQPVVMNGNLFFISWISFLLAIAVLVKWVQKIKSADGPSLASLSYSVLCWYGLCISSLIVLGTSSRFVINYDCSAGASTSAAATNYNSPGTTTFGTDSGGFSSSTTSTSGSTSNTFYSGPNNRDLASTTTNFYDSIHSNQNEDDIRFDINGIVASSSNTVAPSIEFFDPFQQRQQHSSASNTMSLMGTDQFCQRATFGIFVGVFSFFIALCTLCCTCRNNHRRSESALYSHRNDNDDDEEGIYDEEYTLNNGNGNKVLPSYRKEQERISNSIVFVLQQLAACVLLLIFWSIAVFVLTFGGMNSPGRVLGTLFYTTWISYFLSLYLVKHYSKLFYYCQQQQRELQKQHEYDLEASRRQRNEQYLDIEEEEEGEEITYSHYKFQHQEGDDDEEHQHQERQPQQVYSTPSLQQANSRNAAHKILADLNTAHLEFQQKEQKQQIEVTEQLQHRQQRYLQRQEKRQPLEAVQENADGLIIRHSSTYDDVEILHDSTNKHNNNESTNSSTNTSRMNSKDNTNSSTYTYRVNNQNKQKLVKEEQRGHSLRAKKLTEGIYHRRSSYEEPEDTVNTSIPTQFDPFDDENLEKMDRKFDPFAMEAFGKVHSTTIYGTRN